MGSGAQIFAMLSPPTVSILSQVSRRRLKILNSRSGTEDGSKSKYKIQIKISFKKLPDS